MAAPRGGRAYVRARADRGVRCGVRLSVCGCPPPGRPVPVQKLEKITVKIGYPDKWKDYS